MLLGIFDLSFGLADLELDLPFFPLPFACCFGCGDGRPGVALGFGITFGLDRPLLLDFPLGLVRQLWDQVVLHQRQVLTVFLMLQIL